jgi:hypothetical protein
MGAPLPDLPCYLAEWYLPAIAGAPLAPTAATLDDAAAAVNALGSPIRLLSVLAVPSDEVLFGVFAAASEQVVAQTCDRAGMPAQRLTAARSVPTPGSVV